MAVSEKVRFRFDQMLGRISEIPNVALAEKDGLDARLTIREHPPLDSVRVRYLCKNRLFSRDYHTIFHAGGARCASSSWSCSLRYRGKEAFFSSENPAAAEYFNGIPTLAKRCSDLDVVKLLISQSGTEYDISLETMAGSVTWMLIPPLTYQIPADPKEYLGILEILQLCSTIQYVRLEDGAEF